MTEQFTLILKHWYIPLAVIIAFLSIESFIKKYPVVESHQENTKMNSFANDSIINDFKVLKQKRALQKAATPLKDGHNPFNKKPGKTAGKHLHPKKIAEVMKKYTLTGITNGTTAILTDKSGTSIVVGAGDFINAVEVVAVKSDRVLLKSNGRVVEVSMND
ncbi:MAG: hypothetical protein HQK83_15625 [Fibrobacteria bacterium]|nr:hypothetical protein [Fibrobacteria bacterium]